MKSDDLGKLLLRLLLGGAMIPHGIHKIQNGIEGITGMVTAKGLPEFVAYGVYFGELVAPALMVIGFQTRLASLVLAINMGVAIWLAHTSDIMTRNSHGGWGIENQALYLFGALSLVLMGGGSLGVDKR